MYAPKYTITNAILKNIGVIEAAKEVIENAPLVPSYEKGFRTDAEIRTIYHGTHLEGNDLTLIQTKKILEGLDVYGRPRDIQEVINYRDATQLLDELAVKRGGYDASMIRDIHRSTTQKIIAPEKVGVFRTTEVVVKDEKTGEVVFQPPPNIEVPYLIDEFFTWLNSTDGLEINPVLRAAISHYVLVAIHPFVEGNGRTVRAFATLILMREGYDIKRFFSLEEQFDSDPGSYYEALSTVDKLSPNIASRDLTNWLTYFTEVVANELTKIKEKVKKLSIDTRLKVKMGEQISLSERQMRIVEYLTDQGSTSMFTLKRALPMVSEDTVLRDLKDMMNKGIIKKVGSTKASRYVLAKP